MPGTNLGTSLGIKPVRKHAKSLIKTKSKIYKLKIYDKIIDNSIYGNR